MNTRLFRFGTDLDFQHFSSLPPFGFCFCLFVCFSSPLQRFRFYLGTSSGEKQITPLFCLYNDRRVSSGALVLQEEKFSPDEKATARLRGANINANLVICFYHDILDSSFFFRFFGTDKFKHKKKVVVCCHFEAPDLFK